MNQPLFYRRTFACLSVGVVYCAVCAPLSVADEISSCTLSAWSTDTDINGLNVRSSARSNAPIIGQLPLGQEFAAEVTITGSMNGWFRINNATLDNLLAEEPEVIFSGEGWVFGGKLGLALNNSHMYAAPTIESATVATLIAEDAEKGVVGPDSFAVDGLLTCQGSWVEVTGTFLDARMRGWATNTCSNQVTTCP